jgi:hypothetical protein
MNTMEFKKVLSSGILGTSAMTIFSYLVSEVTNENFREPEIMTVLINNLLKNPHQYYAPYLGWSLHYMIGFGFVLIYTKLWDNNKLKPNLKSGIYLGAISGIMGIVGWLTMFKIHPNPPLINLKNFFILLFFAHIIFGIFAMIGYVLVRKLRGHTER